MPGVEIYSSNHCPYCVRARRLLEQKGIDYQLIEVDKDPDSMQKMIERSKRRTVPQIFINDHHVGGCDDLYALEREGKLDALLGLPG